MYRYLEERDCLGRDGELFAGCRVFGQIFAGRRVRPREYRELRQTGWTRPNVALLMGLDLADEMTRGALWSVLRRNPRE